MDAAMVLLALAIHPIASVTQVKLYVLACGAMAMVYVFHALSTGRAPTAAVRQAWPVYAFAVLVPLSVLWSISRPDTIRASATFLASFAVFHASLTLFRRRGPDWFLRVVLFVPIVWSCVAVGVMLRFGSFRSTSVAMLAVVGSLSNQGPAATELAAPYVLYVAITQPRRRRLAILSAACILFVTFASQSRGAWVMSAMTLLMVVALFGRNTATKIRRGLVVAAVVAAVGAGLWAALGGDYLMAPFERLVASQVVTIAAEADTAVEGNDYARAMMYVEGVNAIKDHGRVGIGYNALASFIERKHGWPLVSHNIILTAWGELGLCGMALATLIAIIGTRRIWRARAAARGVDVDQFYLHTSTLIAWALALGHAQARPQLHNPMFHVIIAAVFTTMTQTNHRRRNAHHPG